MNQTIFIRKRKWKKSERRCRKRKKIKLRLDFLDMLIAQFHRFEYIRWFCSFCKEHHSHLYTHEKWKFIEISPKVVLAAISWEIIWQFLFKAKFKIHSKWLALNWRWTHLMLYSAKYELKETTNTNKYRKGDREPS